MSERENSFEDELLADLAAEEPAPGHMSQMLEGAMGRLEQSRQRGRRIRRTAFGGGTALAIVLLMLFVPFSYDVEVGLRVTANWPIQAAAVEAIEADLVEMDGLVGRKLLFGGDLVRSTLIFRGSGADEAAAGVAEVLARHLPADIRSVVETSTITRRLGGNALAAMTHGHFKVNARDMSHEEIELAIIEELSLLGVSGADASVTQTTDGSITIDVQMTDSPVDSLSFEVSF